MVCFCFRILIFQARENVVGWYSTGPKIRPADLEINELFRKYTPNPVYVIIDVQPKEEFEIPTKAYVAIEEVKEVRFLLNSSFVLSNFIERKEQRHLLCNFSILHLKLEHWKLKKLV